MTWLNTWKPSLRDSVSNRLYFKINASLSHSLSLPHRPSLTLSLSRFSTPLTHPLLPLCHHIAHYADHSPSSPIILTHSPFSPTPSDIDHFADHPLHQSPSLTHSLLPLRQTFITSPITLFSHSVHVTFIT